MGMERKHLKSALKNGVPPETKVKRNPTFILITVKNNLATSPTKQRRSVSFNKDVELFIFKRDLPLTLECHDCAFGFDTVESYEEHFRDVHPNPQNEDDEVGECPGTAIIALYDPEIDEPRLSMRELRSSIRKKKRAAANNSSPLYNNLQDLPATATTQEPEPEVTVKQDVAGPIPEQSVRLHKKRCSDFPVGPPEMMCYIGNCDHTFKSLMKAKEHLREEHKEFPANLVSCRTCGQLKPSVKDLDAHQASAHPRNFQCNICNRKFQTEAAKNSHLKVAHGHYCDDNGVCVEKGEAVFLKRVFQAHFKSQGKDIRTGKQVLLT